MASEVLSAKLFDAAGNEKGVVPLMAAVFKTVIKAELIHGVVRWQRAKSRSGTHDVLTRSEMRGTRKKPFKQKGTGGARAGSSKSPIWVGGAVVHGPTPRSYEFSLSKKMRKGALVSALTVKSSQESFMVLEGMGHATGKTSDAVAFLKSAGLTDPKVLIIVPSEASAERAKFSLGLRNITGVTVLPVTGVNVYDLINSNKVLCVRTALKELEVRVGGSAE